MLWALPSIWPEYRTSVYPYWARYLYPAVQIALMSSVYCTIVLSWERYVRICLMSRLMNCSHYISDRAFLLYLGFIVVFPIIFYIPKFFEVSVCILLNWFHKSLQIFIQRSFRESYSLEKADIVCQLSLLIFGRRQNHGCLLNIIQIFCLTYNCLNASFGKNLDCEKECRECVTKYFAVVSNFTISLSKLLETVF